MSLLKFKLPLAALLAAALWSCSGGGDSPEPPQPPMREPVCELSIRVGAAHSAGSAGRAIDGDFETPVFQYENIRTIRAIITRPDGTVEVNARAECSGNRDIETVRYKLKGNEKKNLYLFVNEPEYLTSDLNVYLPGSEATTAGLQALRIKADRPGMPLIDNTGKAAGQGTYVPMSEFYEGIDTSPEEGTPADADVYTKKIDVFVTRAAIKFSFRFSPGKDYSDTSIFEVHRISVSGMTSEGYYLPVGTEYNPAKGTASSNPWEGRYITEFTVPADLPQTTYVFAPAAPLEVSRTAPAAYDPEIYFTESPCESYKVNIQVKEKYLEYTPGAENSSNTWPAQWLNEQTLPPASGSIPLSSLPRNTHVIVNITLNNNYRFEASVTIEPFKSTYLKPSFGFDD